VGLTGEVRSVARLEQRLAEARQMGFQNAIVPRKNLRSLTPPEGLKIIGVGSVEEALEVALGGSIG
jgi:DNA repair protein RadA/Sms